MHCGVATPTDGGVPPRTSTTGAFEVAKVTEALAGRYKVEKVIGEGGMATVYLATDQKHKRKVAVKVMRPELAATPGAERFLREVEIAGQLSHPHILPMYDLRDRPTANVAAYQLYLKARATQIVDLTSLRQQAGFLEQAVALDSTFALA